MKHALAGAALLSLVGCAREQAHPAALEPSTAPSGPSLSEILGADHVQIPMELTASNHLVVEADHPSGPLRFLIDSAASGSVVDPSLTELLEPWGGLPGGSSLADLSLGLLQLDPVEVVVMDLQGINQGLLADGDLPIDGILGAPLLEAMSAVIDYTTLDLYLSEAAPRRLAAELGDALEGGGHAALPVQLDAIGFVELEGWIEGQGPLRTVVDTGATRTVVPLETAEVLGLALSEIDGEASTVQGGLSTYETEVSALALGGLEPDPATLLAIDLSHVNASLAQVGLQPIELLVGGDLLAERGGVLDYVGERLFLIP